MTKGFTMSLSNGFTLIEVIIAVFVLAATVVGLFGFVTLVLKSTHDGRQRIIATALANEKMEMIRNLPYDSVGTVGGIPSGALLQTEQVVRNSSTFTVATDIRYVDDAFDGTVTGTPADLLNTDYKQARVEVSWASNLSNRPVLLITQIAPVGIEGGNSLGTLIFQALNSAGVGVAGATVRLVNSAVSPAVDITTQTNGEGKVIIPGLKPSSGTYQISTTKSGYTTEQTYSSTSSFTPDVDHSHMNALAGQLTNKTFSIDAVSALTIQTVSDVGAALGNIAYTLVGSKKIGTDASSANVYLFNRQDTTGASGTFQYTGLTWDTYAFSIDGAATLYDIKETSVPLPLVLAPGVDITLNTVLVPHEMFTVHATIVNTAGAPIPSATVRLFRSGYDQTLQTGVSGQVFFSPLVLSGDYTLETSAVSYQPSTQIVTVDGNKRVQIPMSAL